MIYVFAETECRADRWVREQELHRRDVRTFSDGNAFRIRGGLRLHPTDRVVVLGFLSQGLSRELDLLLRKCSPPPAVESYDRRVHVGDPW